MKTKLLTLTLLAATLAAKAQPNILDRTDRADRGARHATDRHALAQQQKDHAPTATKVAEGCLLDSMHIYDYTVSESLLRRGFFTYDGQGRKTGLTQLHWDGTLWTNWSYETYTYNGQGYMVQELRHDWDGATWQAMYRTIHTYDLSGNLTETLNQNWVDNEWATVSSYTCVYDPDGNLTEETTIDPFWQWGWGSHKNLYSYDAQGNLAEAVVQFFENNVWQNYFRYIYTFDPLGNLTELIEEEWDEIMDQWFTTGRKVFTYNAENQMTLRLSQSPSGSSWVNSSRGIYYYDAQSQLTELLEQNFWNEVWTNNKRYLNSYDMLGNRMDSTVQVFWTMDNTWHESQKFVYEYDEDSNMTKEVFHDTWWDGEEYEIVMVLRQDYFHTCATASVVEETTPSDISLYPNPAAAELYIHVATEAVPTTMAIYAVSGQCVMRQAYRPQMDIGTLPAGIYFLEVNNGNSDSYRGVYRTRFIKP